MSRATLSFNAMRTHSSSPESLTIDQLTIAGWTGRDKLAVDKHIRELEELGVARPRSTPTYYRVSASRLTFSDNIEVVGAESSGEAEFVLLRSADDLFIGVGSDHTDRKVEAYDVTVSKQMCDKPIAPVLWEFSAVRAHWDELVLRSWITSDGERSLYQEGAVAAILSPEALIAGCERGLPPGSAMFCGTLAARGGVRPATRFDFELLDPVLRRSMSHGYSIHALPISG